MPRSQYSGAIQNVEVQRFVRVDPASFALSGQALSNECWKASRGVADWVIVTDIDEHLYHSDLFTLLIRYKAQATTFIPELGYQMISEKFPGPSERLCETRTPGVPWPGIGKASLFDPMAIEEVNYSIGRHVAAPTGNVRAPPQDELLLLHYKYLGFEHTLARLRQLRSGLGTKDIVNGWGLKYSWLEVQLRENWNAIAEKAVDVREHACTPDRDYTPWWKSLNIRAQMAQVRCCRAIPVR